MKQFNRTYAEVNLDAIRHNIDEVHKNIKEGRATRQNIQKQVVKVQRLHQRLANIRTDYINKTVFSIIKQKPSYITIEDLNASINLKNAKKYKIA